MFRPRQRAFLLAFSLLLCAPCFAWWPKGHSLIAQNAVQILPPEVPVWFREGGKLIAHTAQDPDVQKSRDLPFMTEAETPQHFFDWELLNGQLPPTRAAFYELCRQKNLQPDEVGELPYALGEWTQRLTMTFAEARKFPENREIQIKALVYAGILSHYAGDCAMPLHLTIHHNGRANPDGSSPKTGIHNKVDSLIERLNPPFGAAPDWKSETPLWAQIEAQMKKSQSLVDRVYELENQLPPDEGEWKASPEVVAFTGERAQNARDFTASLFLTAWRDSAKIQVPQWLER